MMATTFTPLSARRWNRKRVRGSDLVKCVIKKLKKNLKKLDNDVSKKDLDDVESRLLKWLKKHRPQSNGNVSPPESNSSGH